MEGSFCGVPMSPSAADRAAAAGSSSFALWTPPESPPAPPLAGHGAATSAGLMGGTAEGPRRAGISGGHIVTLLSPVG